MAAGDPPLGAFIFGFFIACVLICCLVLGWVCSHFSISYLWMFVSIPISLFITIYMTKKKRNKKDKAEQNQWGHLNHFSDHPPAS